MSFYKSKTLFLRRNVPLYEGKMPLCEPKLPLCEAQLPICEAQLPLCEAQNGFCRKSKITHLFVVKFKFTHFRGTFCQKNMDGEAHHKF